MQISDLTKQNRRSNLSPLMEAKAASSQFVPKACPYCEQNQEHYDQYGYCHHLVGFTVPGSEKEMYIFPPPRERLRPEVPVVGEGLRVVSKKIVPIPKGAELVRITVCHRVYDKNAEPFAKKETEAFEEEEPKLIELVKK